MPTIIQISQIDKPPAQPTGAEVIETFLAGYCFYPLKGNATQP
jgi:hypothetical protein